MITVPADLTQCIVAGQSPATVTWAAVTATNADGQVIDCTFDNGGTPQSVSVTTGDFAVGTHTVTCTVTNDAGCTTSASFMVTVSLSGKYNQCFDVIF